MRMGFLSTLACPFRQTPNSTTLDLAAIGITIEAEQGRAGNPIALGDHFRVFALRDIDLTKMESRPLRGRPWEYFFYVDFVGSVKEDHCKKALAHLSEVTNFLRVLGCYESAKR